MRKMMYNEFNHEQKDGKEHLLFMKTRKRILAWITAILLLLPLVGCVAPKEAETAPDPTEAPTEAPAESYDIIASPDDPAGNETEPEESPEEEPEEELPEENVPNPFETIQDGTYGKNAIAIELGDIRITAGEIRNSFDLHVSEFEDETIDRELLSQIMLATEESLIGYYMPVWKAKALGITLSEEQEATFRDEAQVSVDDTRNEMLRTYGDPEGLVEDTSELTEAQVSAALEGIDAMLKQEYGDGFTFDDYLAQVYNDELMSRRVDALSALLKDHFYNTYTVDSAALNEWYDNLLAEQTEVFSDDPDQYLNSANGLEDADYQICLYTPVDAARIQIVCIPSREDDTNLLESNKTWLADLETEYNDLKKSGDDDELLAETEAEIAELKKENEQIAARLSAGEEAAANKMYSDLAGGMSFEDAMEAFGNYDDEEVGCFERVILLDGSEPDAEVYVETVKQLTPGAVSQPVLIDGRYRIIRLVETLPEGPVNRAAIESELNAVMAEENYPEQTELWIQEAMNAAVFHRETYSMLISTYLN